MHPPPLPHVRVGRYDVYLLPEGSFRMDGGAVFGFIPRPQWEQKLPPDAQNRVALGLNQLLIKGADTVVLCDTGLGTKLTPRQREVYGLSAPAPWAERLAPLGLAPTDITHVVFTHLHFDHAGGATVLTDDGREIRPAFPQADHYVQAGEWEDACLPPEGETFAYQFQHFLPLYETGRLHRLRGNRSLLPGIQLHITGGHTRFHQELRISDEGRTVIFPGDVCPTPYHLELTWRTSYDRFPLETIAARRRLLAKGFQPEVLIAFSHDPQPAFRRLTGSPDHPEAVAWHAPA